MAPTDFIRCLLRTLGWSCSFPLPWQTQIWGHLCCWSHIVNLTSNLVELWLGSAALALFTLLMAELIPAALCSSIDPSRSKSPGFCYLNSCPLHIFTHFLQFPYLNTTALCPSLVSVFISSQLGFSSLLFSDNISFNRHHFLNSSFWPAWSCTENGCFPKPLSKRR